LNETIDNPYGLLLSFDMQQNSFSEETNRLRIDPLSGFMAHIEDHYNLNTCQIVVIRGQLDWRLVCQAVRKAVSEFPLLLSVLDKTGRHILKGCWHPDDIPIKKKNYHGDMTFNNPDFRRALMKTLQENPVKWKQQPPISFSYWVNASGEKSALMFNTHHAVADARADTMLLERIMKRYGELMSGKEWKDSKNFPYCRIEDFFLNFPSPKNGPSTFKKHLLQFKYDISVRYYVKKKYRRNERERFARDIDFFYGPLDKNSDVLIREVAKISGHTINTVIFAGLYRTLQHLNYIKDNRVRVIFTISLRNFLEPKFNDCFQNLMLMANMNFKSFYRRNSDLLTDISQRVNGIRSGGIFILYQSWKLIDRIMKIPFLKPVIPGILSSVTNTNVCFSNPGRIIAKLTRFGRSDHPVIEYVGFGCLIPPYDLIIYSPEVNGRLELNVIYRRDLFEDIKTELVEPIKKAIEEIAEDFSSFSYNN